jgi:hypothetical protein
MEGSMVRWIDTWWWMKVKIVSRGHNNLRNLLNFEKHTMPIKIQPLKATKSILNDVGNHLSIFDELRNK